MGLREHCLVPEERGKVWRDADVTFTSNLTPAMVAVLSCASTSTRARDNLTWPVTAANVGSGMLESSCTTLAMLHASSLGIAVEELTRAHRSDACPDVHQFFLEVHQRLRSGVLTCGHHRCHRV